MLGLIGAAMGHAPIRTQEAPDVDRPDSFETVPAGAEDTEDEWAPAGSDG